MNDGPSSVQVVSGEPAHPGLLPESPAGLRRPLRQWSVVEKCSSYHAITPVMATWLDELCRANDLDPMLNRPTEFSAVSVATTAVADYLFRMTKNGACSPQVFVVMTVLLRRLTNDYNRPINSHSVHRMMAACFVLAAKLSDDVFYSHSYYARMLGLHRQDLNVLVEQAIRALQWDLFVGQEDYEGVLDFLACEKPANKRQAHSNAVLIPSPTPSDTTSNESFRTAKSSTCESASTSRTCIEVSPCKNAGSGRYLPHLNPSPVKEQKGRC